MLLLPMAAMAQKDDFGLDFTVEAQKKLSKVMNLSFEGELRTRDNTKHVDRWSAGLSLDYKAAKWLKLSAGYTLLYDNNERISYFDATDDEVLDGDADAVAKGVDAAHDENTSILSYNDENSLACVLSLAFYNARNDYVFHRELPTGKGFADLVLMPRKLSDKPAILLELKKDASVDTAIEQIHRKQYSGKVAQYDGQVILVGINYDSKSKKHNCRIEHR